MQNINEMCCKLRKTFGPIMYKMAAVAKLTGEEEEEDGAADAL